TTFSVDSSGVMSMNPGSTFPLPAGSSAAQAILNPRQGSKFFGVEFMNDTLGSYKVSKAGIITAISISTPPVPLPAMLGAVLHPSKPILYVGLAAQHRVAVYSYDSSQNLTFSTSVANEGQAVCWAAINADGTRLYVSETPSGSITVYDTTN